MSEEIRDLPEPFPNLPSAMLAALDSHIPGRRRQALSDAVSLVAAGHVETRPAGSPPSLWTRTFNSGGACSPSRLVWEARRQGLAVIGSCDPETLDTLPELYAAGDALGVRAAVSLETRVFAESNTAWERELFGEQRVLRVMAAGVAGIPAESTETGRRMAFLREQSRRRCKAVVAKINSVLSPVAVNFERDVLPLTPYGNAADAHIAAAFAAQARRVFPAASDLAGFWAKALGCRYIEASRLLANHDALSRAIDEKLFVRGGSGYYSPDATSYPGVTQFFRDIAAAGAVPCLCWQDETFSGGAGVEALLDAAIGWGALCVGVKFPVVWSECRPGFAERLGRMAEAARARSLPLLVGSNMLRDGDFGEWRDAAELHALREDFLAGAFWLYGHAFLARRAGMGFVSDWASNVFSGDRAAANEFYSEVGRRAEPGAELEGRAAMIGQHMWPDEVVTML